MIDQYSYTDIDGDILTASKSGVAVERPRTKTTLSAYLPKSPAELHKLTEAIHGRKIAAIVYEDEEMPVVEHEDGSFGAGPAVLPRAHRGNVWDLVIGYAAIARHIEARDAAAKERERPGDEAVDRKAEELYEIWRRSVAGGGPKWWELPQGRRDGWRSVARHVLDSAQSEKLTEGPE